MLRDEPGGDFSHEPLDGFNRRLISPATLTEFGSCFRSDVRRESIHHSLLLISRQFHASSFSRFE